MKNEVLTAKQVEHMKPGRKRMEVPAGPPKGLYLIIQTTGAKSWCFRYRFAGKTRKVTYKPYPEMSLKAARAEAEAAIDDLDNNIDPRRTKANEEAEAERQEEAEQLAQESVGHIVDQFIKRALKAKEKARGETERILRKETKAWKHRAVTDITTPDVHELLDGIVDRGHSVMSCRTRGVLLRFFEFAKKRKYIEHSPMIDVDKPGPDHQERERVLDPSELREVWQASESCGYPLAPFMKLLILTGTRRGEAARARWRDIDLETALWRIPPEHSKSSREHLVALSTAAVRFLKSLPRFTDGDFVFTSRSGRIPINGFSKSKERIDAVISARRKEAGNKKTIEPWTMHDIRRSVATLLAKRGIPPHVLSAILGHTAPGAVTASPILKLYNRHQYLDESRAALEAWSEYVLTLTEPIQAECAHA